MEDLVIGIVGMGMIGNTTAVLSTSHGVKTIAYMRNPQKAAAAMDEFDRLYREMVDEQVMTAEQARNARSYLRIVHGYEELAPCTFVFEAIRETPQDKWDCYRELERCCPGLRAIGSCSSSIAPDVLAEATPGLADRILVTHPFFPVHMVPYVELCTGGATSEEATDYALEVLRALDRKPSVLKKPNPGFIGNFLQFALWAAALKLVEDGVCEPQDIDNCLANSFCPRYTGIGIFEHFDQGGYRLNATTCDSVFPALPRYEEAPRIVREKAESADAWGARSPSRRGFYDWSGVDPVAYGKRVNAPYWRFVDWRFPDSGCTW